MGRRLALLLAPLALGSSLLMMAPGQARAGNGMTETGVTTYEVVPAKAQIKVTVTISIANHKPSDAVYFYYWDKTEVVVEKEASAVSATSNAGKVTQKAIKSDTYYRYIELDYPQVLYGQTRVVTATYTIPAGPKAPGGFRGMSAYASLCANGNGEDTGSLSIVLPAGFQLFVDSGSDLTRGPDSNGREVYSTGTQSAPYKLWTCVDAENSSKLSDTKVTADKQKFDIHSWPEDKAWTEEIKKDISTDVPALEKLTGLTMALDQVKINEVGQSELGDYGGAYSSETLTAQIPETIEKDTVAHELAHIWFNHGLFEDRWVSEGLAGYSEQVAGPGNFTPCKEPGTYPGTGKADLSHWLTLTNQPTTQEEAVVDYNYTASCYIFTTLAGAMGQDNFKNVIVAAVDHSMPYRGTGSDEHLTGTTLTAKQLLDLIDEIGMVPGGVKNFDQAGDLLVKYGVFGADDLTVRSTARTKYHSMVTSAGTWHLPLAVRGPMSTWDFVAATTAMSTVQQILDVRSQIQSTVKGLSIDGTQIQEDFEAAGTQADLDAVLALAKKEADAASVVAKAITTHDASRSFLQSIGLMGVDVDTKLSAARADIAAVKPDTAMAEAQSVIDTIDKSGDQGTTRVGMAVGGALAVLLLLIFTIVLPRRRGRRPAAAVATIGFAPTGAGDPTQPFGYQAAPTAWGQPQAPSQQPTQWPGAAQAPQWPPAAPAPQWPPSGPAAGQWPDPGVAATQWPPAQPAQPAQWPPAQPAQPAQWPPAQPAQPAQWPPAQPAQPEPFGQPIQPDPGTLGGPQPWTPSAETFSQPAPIAPPPSPMWPEAPAAQSTWPVPPAPAVAPVSPPPPASESTWLRSIEPAAEPLGSAPFPAPQPLSAAEPLGSPETIAPPASIPTSAPDAPASTPEWPPSTGSDPSSAS